MLISGCSHSKKDKTPEMSSTDRFEKYLKDHEVEHLALIKSQPLPVKGQKFYAGRLLKEVSIGKPLKVIDSSYYPDEDLIKGFNEELRRSCGVIPFKDQNALEVAQITIKQASQKVQIKLSLTFSPWCDRIKDPQMWGKPEPTSVELKIWAASIKEGDALDLFLSPNQPLSNKQLANTRLVKAVNAGEIYLGMPTEALLLSWGEPRHKNAHYNEGQEEFQWVYEGVDVFIQKDKIVSWKRQEI